MFRSAPLRTGVTGAIQRDKRRSSFFVACLCGATIVACGSSSKGGSSEGGGGVANSGGTGAGTGGAGATSNGGGNSGGTSGGASGGGANAGGASGSGTGGTANTGGASGGGPILSGGPSVLQRGNDIYRRATFNTPDLTPDAAKKMAPDDEFDANATFSGSGNTENQGTASVLYLDEGPTAAGCPPGANGCTATARAAGDGVFLAFPALGSDPNVVAFDVAKGLPVWTAHVTSGGDGIRGTPVIDPQSRRLFVVTGGNPHLVHALSVDDGTEVATGGWPVTLSDSTLTSDGNAFTTRGENQHGASLLVNGILYIPFGGQYGDGGTYRGWIVAVDTTDPTKVAGWVTRSPRSGIWGSGGLASDGTYVFGVTGDTTSLGRNQSDSQEVVRVTGLATFSRDAASVFVPTEWQSWDRPAGDLDFGGSTPAFVPLPAGSNPPSLLVAPAKAGRLYILDGSNLSSGTYPNTGGSLAELTVSNTNSESVYTAPTIYTSASGLHAAINVGDGAANCSGTKPKSKAAIVSTLIQPGQSSIATASWCAAAGGGGHTNYPPISTTTDGVSANALVWFINGDQLEAVDGDSGQEVFTTTGTACDGVPSMSFPIAVKNRIVVSALGHLCSWSPNGS